MYSNIQQQSSTMQNHNYFCINLILVTYCKGPCSINIKGVLTNQEEEESNTN